MSDERVKRLLEMYPTMAPPDFERRAFYGEPPGFRCQPYETARPTPRTCQNCGARQEVVRCSYCRKPV